MALDSVLSAVHALLPMHVSGEWALLIMIA